MSGAGIINHQPSDFSAKARNALFFLCSNRTAERVSS
jgi:hypothetical protein